MEGFHHPRTEIDSWEAFMSWALKGCAAPQVRFHGLPNIARLRYRHRAAVMPKCHFSHVEAPLCHVFAGI
jgi:hypothetical protein